MRDPRFQALAAQLAGYSTALRPGDRVLLELTGPLTAESEIARKHGSL